MIKRGSRILRTSARGESVAFEVKAVRYAPVAYAEIEPEGGGERTVVHLAELEKDMNRAQLVVR